MAIQLSGSLAITGSLVATGQIVAQMLNVQQVTSSIVYSCGSNNFGTALNNSQTFTGSMFITGSNIIANVNNTCFSGNVCVGGGLVAQQPSTFCDTVGLFGNTAQLYIGATNGASNYTILKWCTTDKSLNIHNQSTGGTPQLVIACNGNVGVKTIAAPNYDLEVRGNIGVISSTSAGLITTSTLCAAGTITGLIRFDGLHTPSLTTYTGPSINACKDDANYATSLVFKTTDGSGGNNVNLRITGAGVANFSSRVNINGAPDDADIAMVVKAPSGSSKFIMFGRNASDIAVFRISNAGETTANQFISCATDNGSGEYYFIKGNAAVSNNFSIYAYSNILYYNSYSSMYFRANNTGGSGGDIIFSGGNVGIGTTSPSVPLQIRDSSVSSGASAIHAYGFDGAANLFTTRGEDPYNAALYLYNNPSAGQGYGTGIIFRAKSDTTVSQIQGAIYTTWTTATDASRTSKMVFTTTNSGTSSDKVTITGNGIVGIGTGGGITTSTYTGKLAVFTSGAGANIAIGTGVNTNNVVMSRFITVNSNNGNSGNEGSSQFYGITSIESALTTSNSNTSGDSGGYIMFKTKGDAGTLDERLRITSAGIACFACQVCAPAAIFSGCVGIGMTSPSEIFHVNKNNAGNIVGGYFTNSQANTGAESVSLAFGLNRSGGDFVRQIKAITFGAEQQWTGTESTVDGYLSFSTVQNEAVSERMRITSGGNVGIGTCAPNAKLTVWTSSTTGLQTALRLNNPFGFDNLNTGTQIVFSQDRSVAEDLKQGIIAVGQADAGTSATSYMAFYTNNTGLGERLRISSTGVACFATTICTPNIQTGGNSNLSKSSIRLRSSNDNKYLDINSYNTCNIINSNYGDSDVPLILGTFFGHQVNQLFLATNCRVGILTNDPKGLFEVGMTCAKTTFGGLLFNTLSVADSNWFCFFQPPSSWAGLTTMNWVAPNDHNRSGAAQIRWSYQACSADLGPTTSIFNDSQNATATFRYAGGWLQACIGGAGAGYSVQFTIIGARGA
jgi:hypothetical protein